MSTTHEVADAGFVDEPTLLAKTYEDWRGQGTSDRLLSRYYLQLRYARPSGDIISQTGAVQSVPAFVEGFVSAVRQVGYNIFLEVSDGCTAKVCQPLRPKVIPVAAKPNIARQCTLLSRVQDGVLEKSHFLQEATQAWEDSYCYPLGLVLFELHPVSGEITCRRVDPALAAWPRGEGRDPIHFAIAEPVSRSSLLSCYPEFKEEILAAERWEPESILGVDPPRGMTADVVKVLRGWRRKVGDENGRYVVTLNDIVLNGDKTTRKRAGQEWPYEFFPFAFFRNRWDHHGFGGVPMGRFVAPHHQAVNRLARIIEDSLKGAVPMISSHKDSGVNEVSDVPYQVLKWKGSVEPKVVPTNPVSEQALRRVDWHENKCYEIGGINRALSTGKTAPGITSGVALREVRSLGDERASQYAVKWEEGWAQAGHIVVALAKEAKKIKLKRPNQDVMEEIDLTALDIERGDYRISYGVTSVLSKSVPGLLADLEDLKNLSWVDKTDMAQAVGDKIPDIASITDRVTASRRLAAKQVQDALEEGTITVPPSARQGQEGLDAIVIFGNQAWCQAMLNPERFSEENLAVLHRLIKCAEAKKGAPIPSMQPIMPGNPIPAGATMPIGQPAGTVIAHNQYEAASLAGPNRPA